MTRQPGGPRALLLLGEAGIGRTTLFRHAREAADGDGALVRSAQGWAAHRQPVPPTGRGRPEMREEAEGNPRTPVAPSRRTPAPVREALFGGGPAWRPATARPAGARLDALAPEAGPPPLCAAGRVSGLAGFSAAFRGRFGVSSTDRPDRRSADRTTGDAPC
ncbi:hypothetical protein ACF073_11000 [Streptomyces sp. NPDC015171]|uniref:hypothetical protein n=1 Tax=Streptomyces sp. NPDC015171 TaxID=3364945 RepID=UPI0036FD5595